MKSEQTVGDLALDFEFNFYVSLYKKLPNDKRLISILAELYTRHGEIEKGLELDRKLVEIDESNATAHYNLACSLSLVENFEEAICALRKSISLGYCDFNWMLEDQDLQALRTTEYFTQLKRDLGFL
ncbi:MAG: hypothetical protein CNB76_02510 [Puniceicoccaceae bacterium MED-G32]|jgi:tetratricopeptide (TPR) repeat protein|nr:hypothetical protein [Puniceicoccaceae bacterium]PDH26241.1 MAG: hypothetical protein CNB76_02510 [Puniceicoccaceae bacterium MED-G32]RPG15206.1 MAG: hypothetical protein CBD67_002710 [Opitutales bacterium TMED207]|tara:strand:+ start:25567 stop:25947 length:381 start_codon:yes stop_codon:yes gene_type:complete